jgi:hypothetical protein
VSPLGNGRPWGELSRAGAVPWKDNLGTFAGGSYSWRPFFRVENRPGGFLASGRAPVFHYALFAHYHDRDNPDGAGASGISRGIGGTDLLLTLGNFTDGTGTPREQAGTLMHELGHNLGLRHGGCDDTNLKPGYLSIMNYAYQMDGVSRGGMRGVLDYSRGASPVLDDLFLSAPASLLGGDSTGAPDAALACVARGEVRAGLAVKNAVPPVGGTASGDHDDCADGSFDDWKHVRLDLGGIGRRPERRR